MLSLPHTFTREKDEATETFVLRPLEKTDFQKGFRDLLAVLSDPGELDEEKFIALYEGFFTEGQTQRCLVVEHVEKKVVVSTSTLLLEQKFLRGGKKVGHIEDVITHPDYQKRGLAKTVLVKNLVLKIFSLS